MIAETAHRPWPVPHRAWVLAMRWHDLAFLHWPVAAGVLRPLISPTLELDTFEDQAWLAVTPFRMSRVRPIWMPALPCVSAFPELNVRTYVTARDKPGVWFFSLDAGNAVAVRVAQWTFGLPYYDAQMSVAGTGECIRYESVRTHRGALPARFAGWYWPTGASFRSRPDTIEHWLTERYCLYVERHGVLYRGEIHHEPWPLQPAGVEIETNTMAAAVGIELPERAPLVHFARQLDVVAWMVERV